MLDISTVGGAFVILAIGIGVSLFSFGLEFVAVYVPWSRVRGCFKKTFPCTKNLVDKFDSDKEDDDIGGSQWGTRPRSAVSFSASMASVVNVRIDRPQTARRGIVSQPRPVYNWPAVPSAATSLSCWLQLRICTFGPRAVLPSYPGWCVRGFRLHQCTIWPNLTLITSCHANEIDISVFFHKVLFYTICLNWIFLFHVFQAFELKRIIYYYCAFSFWIRQDVHVKESRISG